MQTAYTLENLPQEFYLRAGGKAGTLARLARRGYPVPPGLVILPEAFEDDRIKEANWQAVRQEVELLVRAGIDFFAVRSSAAGEDSAEASFAGEFDSFLNISPEDLLGAVNAVRRSRHNRRAAAYAAARGQNQVGEMAVLVQAMVPALISGVLFSADPVSGARDRMVGNYIHGLGDRLVSGEVNPTTFELLRPAGQVAIEGQNGAEGLLQEHAPGLFQLGSRLETELNSPQDIEWAIAGDGLHLLQARPITSFVNHDPKSGAWNDSRLGDYLWTNTNFGEALPDVMTPLTWSAMRIFFRVNRIGIETEALPMGGNIAGRLYMNLSLAATFFTALGFSEEKMRQMAAETFGAIPEEIHIPRLLQSRWGTLKTFIPNAFRRMRLIGRLKKQVPEFVKEAPARAARLQVEIKAAETPQQLADIWRGSLRAEQEHTMLMLAAGTSDYKNLSRRLRARLVELVGEGDANALMSGLDPHDHLASLGPLVGLNQVAQEAMTPDEYLKQFGHRGPSEFELSIPTPGESPREFEALLEEVTHNGTTAIELLNRKHLQHQAAWERLAETHPRQAPGIRRQLERLAQASRTREAVRSEVVRMHRVLRSYALRVGEIARIGDDVFYLSLDEILIVLEGNRSTLHHLPKRKETIAHYRSMPPYPAIIRGRFDPEKWGRDPRRRTDRYDPYEPGNTPDADILRGFSGSPGVVEGYVRVMENPGEATTFLPGEILVANTTNVGWTPLFPRAAAIVTDIGAPLSHAAIVARELGIPAVVGTGSATMRLRTGDRVRVNGQQGTVEFL